MDLNIIRSKRRSIGLIVTHDARVVVRAPFHVSNRMIEQFIKEKEKWLFKHLEQARLRQQEVCQRKFNGVEREDLIRQYRKQAKELFPIRVAHYAVPWNLNYKAVKISNASSRWGSCSRLGSLNFSWRLMMAPLAVVDYVVVHELAHLKHLNHSIRFWSWVQQMMPEYREPRRWLKENGHLLVL